MAVAEVVVVTVLSVPGVGYIGGTDGAVLGGGVLVVMLSVWVGDGGGDKVAVLTVVVQVILRVDCVVVPGG